MTASGEISWPPPGRISCPPTRTRVAAWIDEYNRDRKHSSIGMRSPIDYEFALHKQPEAAA